MDERTEDKFEEVYKRLRETEAQTREQNVQIQSLCERLDANAKLAKDQMLVTDKFLEHFQRMETRNEKREQAFWKYIGILIGAVVALALGPKVASEIITQYHGGSKSVVTAIDFWHDQDRRNWIWVKEEDDVA